MITFLGWITAGLVAAGAIAAFGLEVILRPIAPNIVSYVLGGSILLGALYALVSAVVMGWSEWHD